MKTRTYANWERECALRFGTDQLRWKFTCPACGNVQMAEDFRPFQAQGADTESAFKVCLGRYKGARREALGTGSGPCNYAAGGLFNFNPIRVVFEDGSSTSVFAFSTEKEINSRIMREMSERTPIIFTQDGEPKQ